MTSSWSVIPYGRSRKQAGFVDNGGHISFASGIRQGRDRIGYSLAAGSGGGCRPYLDRCIHNSHLRFERKLFEGRSMPVSRRTEPPRVVLFDADPWRSFNIATLLAISKFESWSVQRSSSIACRVEGPPTVFVNSSTQKMPKAFTIAVRLSRFQRCILEQLLQYCKFRLHSAANST